MFGAEQFIMCSTAGRRANAQTKKKRFFFNFWYEVIKMYGTHSVSARVVARDVAFNFFRTRYMQNVRGQTELQPTGMDASM